MKFFDHTIYTLTKIDRHEKTSVFSVPSVVNEQTTSGFDISLTNSAFTQFRTSNYTYIADKRNDEGVKTSNGNGLEEALYKGFAFELIDTAGVVKAHYEYSPFGKVVYKSGLMKDENPFQFSTKYLDNETQLYYYGYRYYNPENGRWINRDPIGESGGWSIYSFALNNSINYFDNNGLKVIGYGGVMIDTGNGNGNGSPFDFSGLAKWWSDYINTKPDPSFDPYFNPVTGGRYSNNSMPEPVDLEKVVNEILERDDGGQDVYAPLDSLFFMDEIYHNENWLAEHYPDSLSSAKEHWTNYVDSWIAKNCGKSGMPPTKPIDNGELPRSNNFDGTWEYITLIGTFTWDLSNVTISYTEGENGMKNYSWAAELKALDVVGENWFLIYPENLSRRGLWILSGSGECCDE